MGVFKSMTITSFGSIVGMAKVTRFDDFSDTIEAAGRISIEDHGRFKDGDLIQVNWKMHKIGSSLIPEISMTKIWGFDV